MRTTTRAAIAGLAVGAALALPSGAQAASVQKPPCKRTFQGERLPENSLCLFKLVRGKRFYIPKKSAYYTVTQYFIFAPDGSIVFDEQSTSYNGGLQVQSIYPVGVGQPSLKPPRLPEITHHPNLSYPLLLGREYWRYHSRGQPTVWVVPKAKTLYALTMRGDPIERQGR